MQAQRGFENSSMMNTFIRTFKADGIKGLYRYKITTIQIQLNQDIIMISDFFKRLGSATNRFRNLSVNSIFEIRSRVIK